MKTGTADPPGPTLLLDACAVINLWATRHMQEILVAVDMPVGVVERVRNEATYVIHGGPNDDANEREPVELTPLIDRGLLHLIVPTEVELEAFVGLTIELDDGEAMTAAIATTRGWPVVTEDRKARRVLAGRVPLRSTLDLINTWSDLHGLDEPYLRMIMTDLRERGRYLPRRNDPLRAWWNTVLNSV